MVNKFLYPRGGCESYMLSLGACLEKMGHQVEYFGMYDEKNTVGNSVGLYTKNMDFHSKFISRFLYPFKILYSLEAKKKIQQVIDSFKPDIVHMNNINFQLTPSIIDAVKKRNIPLVQTVHDYQMICPNHVLYNFDKNEICESCLNGSYINCFKYKCIHNSKIKSLLGIIEAKLYSLIKTYNKVDLYICPSNFLENKLLSSKDFYKGKTFAIHNFINKKEFSNKEFINTGVEKEPYILFVGRLSKEKGVEFLAKTAKLLDGYKFIVAGNGPDEDVLHNIDNVELTGFLTGKELLEVLASAKILLVPSVWYENCPISILEALCMGIPVVTMNSGGMAELVEDGVTGTLVNVASTDCIAQKIKETIDDEDYYNKLKENCQKMKDRILSVEDYCDILIEKYNYLINGR